MAFRHLHLRALELFPYASFPSGVELDPCNPLASIGPVVAAEVSNCQIGLRGHKSSHIGRGAPVIDNPLPLPQQALVLAPTNVAGPHRRGGQAARIPFTGGRP